MSVKSIGFSLVALWLFASPYAAVRALQDAPARSVWNGVYSTEQSKRGEALYTPQCGACHGATLEGGEMAPPLAGGTFNSNWNGLTLADLVDRIRVSMPQNNPGSLSRQQTVDLVAFMLSAGGFPAGTTDLPREAEALKQIAFEALKR